MTDDAFEALATGQLRVLRVEDLAPGDVIVLTVPKPLENATSARIRNLLAPAFPKQTVFILDDGATLTAMRPVKADT